MNRLNDLQIKTWLKQRRAGTAAKGKLFDGGGLHLLLTPKGTPCWRLKFRLDGKGRVSALGVYPEVSLAAARLERERLRALVKQGKDPMVVRAVARAQAIASTGDTFEALAAEWIAAKQDSWSARHHAVTLRAFQRDVFPTLGKLPMADITAPMITGLLDRIQRRTTEGQRVRETAARVRVNIARVFAWGVARGRCTQNPTPTPDAVLRPRPTVKPQPALLTFEALGAVLRGAATARMLPAVYLAHRLVSYTAQRMTNVVAAKWTDFDLEGDTPTWTIARAEMKVGEGKPDHRVPLGPTMAGALRAWRRDTGGRGAFVCASGVSKYGHVRIDSIDKAYRETLGLRDRHVPHGWRASFRTLASAGGFDVNAIELFLDHEIQASAVVKAYERNTKWEERVQLAYWWDAQLTAAQHGTTPLQAQGVA